MSRKTIVRSPRGANSEVVPLDMVQVPDMWHLAMALNNDPTFKPEASEQVLEVWHLCCDLLATLKEYPDYPLGEMED
ncbi:hypothetical protein LCGC14_1404970 [marine sediment metagenome]|uniref:Uncharacterized protein n=1 Tax=marine sediment metagenome TaxID=412755 RepID=A0A0F9JVY8_9ZZZZ